MDRKNLVVDSNYFEVNDMYGNMLEAELDGVIANNDREIRFIAAVEVYFDFDWDEDQVKDGSIKIHDYWLNVDHWYDEEDDELNVDEVEEIFGMNYDNLIEEIRKQLRSYIKSDSERYIENNAIKDTINWAEEY